MSLDDKIIQEWELRTGQAVSSVNALAKEIRAEQAHEKKLQLIRAELDKQTGVLKASTDKLSASIKGQGDTFTWASVKGNLYAAAITAAASAVKSAVKDGLEWDDTIGKNVESLRSASSATAGMIDKLTLQGARMKLTEGEFNATEKQLTALGVAAVQYGRITREDFGPALDKLTTAIVGGAPSKAFRKLGLDVQFTGTKSEQMAKALAMLEEKFGGTTVKVENASEAVDQAKAAWRDLTAEFVAAAVAGGHLQAVLMGLTSVLRGYGKGTVTLGDMGALEEATRKSKYPTWEAEQIAKGSEAGASGLSSAIGARATEQALAQQKAMLKLIRGGKSGGGTGKRKRVGETEFEPDTATIGGGLPGMEGYFDPGMGAGAMSEAASGIDQISQAYLLARDAAQKFRDVNKETLDDLRSIGVGALTDFASGLWAAADAAIAGGESMGMAIAKMTKSTLLGIAQQSTVKSIFNLAEAAAQWFNPVAVSSHLTAAALFGSIALGTGAAGLGVSAGIAGAGGYSSGRSSSGSGSSSSSARRSSFGSRKDNNQPIYVTVLIDPTKNGAARYVGDMEMRKVLLKKAA